MAARMGMSSGRLTRAERARYRRDGYLVVRLSGERDLKALRRAFDRTWWRARRRGRVEEERDSSGALAFQRVAAAMPDEAAPPDLRATSMFRRGSAIAAQILRGPPERIDVRGFFFRKPPGSGPTPLHQHAVYARPAGMRDAVTLWMSLDGVTVDDGCLTFVPASHRGELLPQAGPFVDPAAVAATDLLDLPLPPGHGVVIHERVAHGAHANVTRRARRAAVLFCVLM